jgi:DNA-binding NtrC family response regulator/tetratricopeptide (TPR) repeat protein
MRLDAQLLKLELLERVGQHDLCSELAGVLLRSRGLSASRRSVCEFVMGRIACESGETDIGIAHLQRAISLGIEGNDLERVCWAEIALVLILADRNGPQAALPLMSDLRLNITKYGDPHAVAALHLFVGEMEGKYGHLHSALRHAGVAQRILATSENKWLDAVAANLLLAISILRADVRSGLSHGLRALELAEESGTASTLRACLGNLGNLFHVLGDFERAADYFKRALTALPSEGEKSNATLDSMARIRMDQDQLDECGRLLERIGNSIRTDNDRALYAHRSAELTRTQLLLRQGNTLEALNCADSVLRLADVTGDELLRSKGLLAKAELLQLANRPSDYIATLNRIVEYLTLDSSDLYANYERILAVGLVRTGEIGSALIHLNRAKRIHESLPNNPGLLDLKRSWTQAISHGGSSETSMLTQEPTDPGLLKKSIVHGIASIMLHAGRPDLVAHEIIDLLTVTNSVSSATAIARAPDGSVETLAQAGEGRGPGSIDEQRLVVGTAREREIEILVTPKPDLESIATIHSVSLLLATLHELERAREEREERATLWPVDELPSGEDGAVTVGHMREVMTLAKRVANANVSVLITGESGTGKEVVARAIHAHSSRARKAFIPFNCTAVPRELLESQLFGHRRGAFTGADRDHPGVIRTARDGTLFLDEIGEMSLELQPKLLRFLESGEICPLGESTPFVVNVRIVAATNSNLEGLVKSGRFREDLFYRLNVIRLSIRPLRERRDEIPTLINLFLMRAAEEFRKSHIRMAEETMERLVLHAWPGNVRQLQNEIRRIVALADPGAVLRPDVLSGDIVAATSGVTFASAPAPNDRRMPTGAKLNPTLSRIEREMIVEALREHHGKVDAVAKALGISRKGLYLKRQRLGL